ncbi:hypothetical protein FVR03_13480 [Pontibacter qinzhouensis]|uniref:Uncharacterized protein n=1 Tax=Pontibacter qinzhouensis TaxID=2603253 RepID=A0A5C8K328_9BACT|nr:hypothetical protein [Pontibacter qinzhouensis]TXK44648.1 hypothetical protein FVR03_13480 [Pontibacter qinzhouensis]
MIATLLTSHFLKYAGFALVAVGIPTLFLDNTIGAEVPLLMGLFFIFISKEKMEDERSYSLRFSSMTLAFLLAFIVAHLTGYLFTKGLITWQLEMINHFSILVFALAIAIFYARIYLIKE